MKIEKGKTYRNEKGLLCRIVADDAKGHRPFVGLLSLSIDIDCVVRYGASGEAWDDASLVEEVVPKLSSTETVYLCKDSSSGNPYFSFCDEISEYDNDAKEIIGKATITITEGDGYNEGEES